MQLQRVEVRTFRNLTSISIHPCPGLNIIEGENASGKTSFLEALHILSVGRSFRTAKVEQTIQHGADSFTLFAELLSRAHHRIGIQRFKDQRVEYRLDGRRLDNRTEIAQCFPLQAITPDSLVLLTGSPGERRRYLDWLMFHVEPSFHHHWTQYQRNLKQRNAALRQRRTDTLSVWSEGLVEYGLLIDKYRKTVLDALLPYIMQYVSLLLPDMALQVSYRQGWKTDSTLSESLSQTLDTDLKMKYTTIGPHRADIVFKDRSDKVSETFSRGQLKLLLCALKLAQMSFLHETIGISPVVLIDDLPAELDTAHRSLLLDLLYQLQTQVYVTTTSSELLEFSAWNDVKLFHVEHGEMKEVV